jgi:putative FmdB family regulatory protein
MGFEWDPERDWRRLALPLYEYACLKCKRHTDKIENVNGPHLKKCPHCGGKVEPVITAPAIQFKGSGWYVTDYAKKTSGGDGGGSDKGDKSEKGEKTEKSAKAEKSDAKSAPTKGEKKGGSAKEK